MWRYLFPFHVVSQPSITNHSFESDFVAIYWEQGDAVESYKIQYSYTIRQCTNDSEMVTQVIDYKLNILKARNSYTIHNSASTPVEEDSDYKISLIAVNSNVSSPAAVIVNTTKEAGMYVYYAHERNFNLLNIPAPSGAPMSIINTSNSSTSIAIAWESVACDQRNGEIDGYNVTYYPNTDDAKKTTVTVYGVTDSNRTFLAHGLQPLTNYTFEVRAFNGDMYGPGANATFQTSVSEGISSLPNDSDSNPNHFL